MFQELLVYKWYPPTNGITKLIHFDLKWKREFSKPLLAIDCLDVMGDGMRELVVVSLTGVHILQVGIRILSCNIIIENYEWTVSLLKIENYLQETMICNCFEIFYMK